LTRFDKWPPALDNGLCQGQDFQFPFRYVAIRVLVSSKSFHYINLECGHWGFQNHSSSSSGRYVIAGLISSDHLTFLL